MYPFQLPCIPRKYAVRVCVTEDGGGDGPGRAFRSKVKPKVPGGTGRGAGAGALGSPSSALAAAPGVTRTRQGTVQTNVPPLPGVGGCGAVAGACCSSGSNHVIYIVLRLLA